jgi:hypothetical protein
VVDVLAMFRSPRGEKQSNYDADYEAVKGLQKIALDFGIAVVVVHHLRKMASEGDPFEKVSGTLGLSGGADTVMILDRDSSGTTLYARGRDIEEVTTAVQFDHETCRWRVMGEASDARRSDERNTILQALYDAPAAMSPPAIALATGMKPNNIKQLLFKMKTDGEVVKAKGRGLYLHPDHEAPKAGNSHNPITVGDADGTQPITGDNQRGAANVL